MCGVFFTHVDQVLDQHPEGCPPVTDVVLADDTIADELVHADERVADHGRTKMTDVHFLRHVRRRVVDDDGFGGGHGPNAETAVAECGPDLIGDERRRERDVEESRTGDIDGRAHVRHVTQSTHDIVGDVTRRAADRLRNRQSAVHLCIGVLTRSHHRIDG